MNIHAYIARKNREFRGQIDPEILAKLTDFRPERRVIEHKIELRTASDNTNPGTIIGYAAKYNTLSQDLGGFIEKLAPGCFNGVMGGDTCCLRNHADDNLLGRTVSNTLRLSLDDVGLKYTCDLPNTSAGRDTAEMVSRGDMRGSSFQFSLAMDGQEWDFDGPYPLRTVTKIGRLYDVAPVTNPAYLDTQVDMRSFQSALEARSAAYAEKLRAEAVRKFVFFAEARLWLAEASN